MAITIQSTYPTSLTDGFAGMLADGCEGNRISGTIEDAAGVAFGKAVFNGTSEKGLTATPGTKFKGITIADAGVVPATLGGTVDLYPQYSTASVMDEGDIWVVAGANTTKDAQAYVTSAGVITPTVGSNTLIPATFMSAVNSGAVVKLRVVKA